MKLFSIICAFLSMPFLGQAQIFNQTAPPSSNAPSGVFTQTDPGPLPTVTDTPIDSGVVFLIFIGMALGVRSIHRKRTLTHKSL